MIEKCEGLLTTKEGVRILNPQKIFEFLYGYGFLDFFGFFGVFLVFFDFLDFFGFFLFFRFFFGFFWVYEDCMNEKGFKH